MSQNASHLVSPPPHLQIQDRCRVMGIATWRFDADGKRLSSQALPGPLEAWLHSSAIEQQVREHVQTWMTADGALAPASLAPGAWLIPVVESQRRRRRGVIAAAAFGPGAIDSDWLRATCEEAGIPTNAVRDALAPVAIYSKPQIERLALVLAWSQADLESVAQNQASIAEFSRKLAESYEEITLLQKLGRAMNQVAQPKRFVALACDELQKTLPFTWVAARFVSDRKAARMMAGRLHVSGEAPCPRPALDAQTERLLAGLSPVEAMVISADESARAELGPSQLLVHPVARDAQVIGAIFAGGKLGDDPQVSSTDIKLLEAASAYLTILLDNSILYDDQHFMFIGTLEALTSAIDAKDPYTCGHSERVAELAAALAAAHGLDDESVERIRLAGVVHDVGKIGVPEGVLCKTGRLTDEEFAQIKQHPEIGYQILKDIPRFEDLLPGVLYHHERFDGRGYPSKLSGENIPLMARIIGLVDAFDAMSSNRTYRSAMPRDRVMEELTDHAGSQFDPELVKSFANVDLTRYDELVEKHQMESDSGSGGLRIRRSPGAGIDHRGGLAA